MSRPHAPTIQKADLDAATPDVHGLISKQTADAWTVGAEPCTFVEFSRGNDYYA